MPGNARSISSSSSYAAAIYEAAGITEEFWADAAMDFTHLELARIATAAVTGKKDYYEIADAAFEAWSPDRSTEANAAGAEAQNGPAETAESLVPNTDHPHDGTPGDPAAAGEYGSIHYVDVDELTLSPDVPQFKEGASETGEVEPFDRFDERVAPPIHVWRRLDGRLEVVSGRHRWQARKRDGGRTIMAYIHEEAAGFTQRDAAMLDATLNIKEGQGTVLDWARYIRSAGITLEEARADGLMRGRGALGVTIGAQAGEDLFSLFSAGKIGEKTAAAIASFADHEVQRVGIRCVQKRMTAQETVNVMAAVQARLGQAKGEDVETTGDLFGDNDEALIAAERIGEFATAMQKKIAEKINAVRGAAKRPETARGMGVNINDPAALLKRLADLEMQRQAWMNYAQYPELYGQAAAWDGVSSLDSIEPARANLGVDMSASTIDGREVDLRRCKATDAAGRTLDKETFITTPNGRLDWFNFPKDERTRALLRKKGIADLPIRLRVGQHRREHEGFGLMHILNHYSDMELSGNSPLEFLYHTLTRLTGLYDQGGNRRTFKANRTYQEGSLLHVDLQEKEGCYSMVSCYPVQGQFKPRGNELLIGGTVFRFTPNSKASPFEAAQSPNEAVMIGGGTRGKARENNVAQPPPSVNIYDVRIIDSRGNHVFTQPRVPDISFSLSGTGTLIIDPANYTRTIINTVKAINGEKEMSERDWHYLARSITQGSAALIGPASGSASKGLSSVGSLALILAGAGNLAKPILDRAYPKKPAKKKTTRSRRPPAI